MTVRTNYEKIHIYEKLAYLPNYLIVKKYEKQNVTFWEGTKYTLRGGVCEKWGDTSLFKLLDVSVDQLGGIFFVWGGGDLRPKNGGVG